MNSKKFFNERRFILLCCKINLGKNDLCQIEEIVKKPLDWSFLWEQSLYHGITCFLYLNFKKAGLNDKIPAEVYIKFEDFYNSTLLKNLLLWNEFCNIYDLLIRNEINVVPIKGIMLNEIIYSKTNHRPMEDIDLLIQKSDLLKVERLLYSIGYQKYTLGYSKNYFINEHCEVPFKKKYICDIHWNLTVPRPNQIALSGLWQNIKEHVGEGEKILTLSPEDTLFSLALHLRRYNQPFSLRYIYDIYNLLIKYEVNFNWDYIINESKKNRTKSTLYFALFSAYKFFGAPVSSYVLNKLKPGPMRNKLMQSLISKYTFSPDLIKKSKEKAYLYVFLRFLLYDKAWDFITFIIFIPIEEFARFYSLPFPSKKSLILFRIRYIYIPFQTFINLFGLILRSRVKYTNIRKREYSLIPKKLFKKIVGRNKNILEIGSGEGSLSIGLAKNDNNVTGIDISENYINIAKNNAPKKLTVRFEYGDAKQLNFKDENFDYVISSDFIEHLKEEDLFKHLQEVSRVLKKNGSYLFWTPSRLYGFTTNEHFKEYILREILPILNNNNFKDIKIYYPHFILLNIVAKLPTSLIPFIISYERILESFIKYLPKSRTKFIRKIIVPPIFISASK